MIDEKRMAGDYEILQSIHIGDREVVFGQNVNKKMDLQYMCGYCTTNEIFSRYEESMVSGDYLEIMKLFCERVTKQIAAVRDEQHKLNVPLDVITSEMCYPNDFEECIEGKVVAIKATTLRNEYQTAAHQLVLVTGGFGAQAHARGSACFATNVFNGKHSRWERCDIQGEVKSEYIPDWAKEKLAVIQSEKPTHVCEKEER